MPLALVMVALTWLNLQRQEAPPPPAAEPPETPPNTPALPAKVSLPLREQTLRFDVAQPSAAALPLPRQIWESVQEVRRRVVAWFAATVQRALARRGTLLERPAFVFLL